MIRRGSQFASGLVSGSLGMSKICDKCKYPQIFAAIEQHLIDNKLALEMTESARDQAVAEKQNMATAYNLAEEEKNELNRQNSKLEDWIVNLMVVVKQNGGQKLLNRMGSNNRSHWEALESTADANVMSEAEHKVKLSNLLKIRMILIMMHPLI